MALKLSALALMLLQDTVGFDVSINAEAVVLAILVLVVVWLIIRARKRTGSR